MTSNLIHRLERATGPDRELDAEIAVAIKHDLPAPMGECQATLRFPHKSDDCAEGTYWLVQLSGKSLRTAPHYTASLDAALTLVPEGCQWTIEADTAWLRWPEGDKIREAQGAFNRSGGKKTALALCIAALKAREENAK